MSFYGGLAATATRLLTQFGQACTLVVTPRDGASTTTTGVAVEEQITEGQRSRAAINGTPMPSRAYIVSNDVTPVLGARLTVGALTGVVMQVDPIRPGDTVLAWQVQVGAG